MTNDPPNAKGPRRLSTTAAPGKRDETIQPRAGVNAGGMRAWLEVAGNLVELARQDPERGLRYLETWTQRMRRAV